jgi:hypothetical protein
MPSIIHGPAIEACPAGHGAGSPLVMPAQAGIQGISTLFGFPLPAWAGTGFIRGNDSLKPLGI